MKQIKLNKTIGIIGGMGPQASAKLLNVVLDICAKELKIVTDEDFPEIILDSVPTPDFISDKRKMSLVANILKTRIKNLEAFEPAVFGIACNSAHLLFKDLQSTTNVPFVSIIDEVTKTVVKSGIRTVGILGTPVTINSKLYESRLMENNINVITPRKNELNRLGVIIGKVSAGKEIYIDDVMDLVQIASSMKGRGAQGIILGCTELPLIFPNNMSIRTFDSIEILAQGLINKSYETVFKNGKIKT